MAWSKYPTNEPSPFNILEEEEDDARDEQSSAPSMKNNDDENEGYEDQNSVASDTSDSSDNEEQQISSVVKEDMRKFEESFREMAFQYRLIDRIGEGTFSTVYKAEDLLYERYSNEWDPDSASASPWVSPPLKGAEYSQQTKRTKYVAIKKIYVTSSPTRIQNELELLYDLRNCKDICPLITAFRHHDQVVAVLPYYRHQDFREYFRHMVPHDMQIYLRSLFSALGAVHKEHILHRDIKPTNFLYDVRRERGVLVDFGLAEREGTDSTYCLCTETAARRRPKIENSYAAKHQLVSGHHRSDPRPSRRANRAGTRGFRAPEVLFKCTKQTTKIDVWSAGVILLSMLSQRFPFFNSSDDVDAMIEISSIFGKRRMAACALLHGEIFECSIPTVGEKGFPFEKLILWSTCRQNGEDDGLTEGELLAIRFLERCLELDPRKRISAKEALTHEFLREETVLPVNGKHESEEEINIIG